MMETDETPICNGNLEGSEHDDCEMVEDNEIVAELSHEQKVKLAEQKKLEGNQFYTQKNYRNALALYTEAIDLCPTCAAYYGNRSATYLMLYKYQDALEDSRRATALDDGFVKGYLREGKCHLAMGNATAALNSYQKVLVLDPKNNSVKSEMNNAKAVLQFVESAEGDFEKGDFRRALYCMDRCLDHSPACPRFKVMKAEALAHLGRYQESQESANDVLRSDNLNADAIYVRGVCLYYEDQVDKAYQHFQQVLRLAPDHVKSRNIYKKAKSLIAKKEEGNQAFRSGHLEDAYRLYTEALEIDPNNKSVNSKLFCNRATVCSKLTKLEEAIEDCSKAIELDSKYLKAYLRRARCYSDTEKYEEAVRDYEKIFKMEKSHEHKRLLQEAKLELKKSKRKDFYKVLGVSKNATDDEIKKAYKKRALIHHPDRHSHDTPEKQREEEKIFKEIGEAYSILSDPKKKARYDSGQDLEDMEGGFADFDPNTIFQAFFGGGQQGFSFGGGPGFGGRPSNSFHQSNSFPGGFSFQFG